MEVLPLDVGGLGREGGDPAVRPQLPAQGRRVATRRPEVVERLTANGTRRENKSKLFHFKI